MAKVPRWDLQKFSTVDARIGSAMQSVGEARSSNWVAVKQLKTKYTSMYLQ